MLSDLEAAFWWMIYPKLQAGRGIGGVGVVVVLSLNCVTAVVGAVGSCGSLVEL